MSIFDDCELQFLCILGWTIAELCRTAVKLNMTPADRSMLAKTVMHEMFESVKQLHALKVIHRDISSNNVMIRLDTLKVRKLHVLLLCIELLYIYTKTGIIKTIYIVVIYIFDKKGCH